MLKEEISKLILTIENGVQCDTYKRYLVFVRINRINWENTNLF